MDGKSHLPQFVLSAVPTQVLAFTHQPFGNTLSFYLFTQRVLKPCLGPSAIAMPLLTPTLVIVSEI